MEIAIPLIALSGLYFINSNKKEDFQSSLPNTDVPDVNYGQNEISNNSTMKTATENIVPHTSKIMNDNKYSSDYTYTDRFFKTDTPQENTPKYKSLQGTEVDMQYFQHNNMMPYFGSTLRTNHLEMNSKESILDNYVGNGSQYVSKKEQSPLFSPHDNLQWAYGAPNESDFIQSRINPSNKMSNVKPFEEQRVGPGLGLGYTTEGQGGFNSGMALREQWMDKGVDELRVANKPKSSGHIMYGREGPADSRIKNLATVEHMGTMEKNRPEKSFEWGTERAFTTTGIEKGPTMRSIPVIRDQSRADTTSSYVGIANAQQQHSTYVYGEYMPSHNNQLGEYPMPVANANGRGFANTGDYGIQSHQNYSNNRTENKNTDYYGIIGGAIGAVITPLMDILKPSRKENTIGTLRPYQNPSSKVPQSYIFNPADKPSHTIREMTENSKFHLNVNANQNGGAYKVSSQQPYDTNRTHTNDYYYAGGASAGERGRGIRPYDSEYNQRNNDVKSSAIQGYMVQGNMKLMNGDINMQSQPKEKYLKNNRDSVPNFPNQTPDVETYGQLQGSNKLYSNIQMDRTTPEFVEHLKDNPYSLNIQNYFQSK